MNPQNEEAEQLLTSGQRGLTALLILRRDTESPLGPYAVEFRYLGIKAFQEATDGFTYLARRRFLNY